MRSNRFLDKNQKADTPIINRHSRKSELKKEKSRQINRCLSFDSFFTKAPEELLYDDIRSTHSKDNSSNHCEDPFNHDWVNVMWGWANGKF
ncbi:MULTISPECIES: hypothetical protein [unclassified Legionella]|uniref:hypothetical protein n=1 Tax=unclassified Legionella TaxID=2622702 RepID=UPI001055E4DD|nr:MULTISPECIES: hypothetical protein [unclassified Legionella]MDI9819704.1 hypothetical protein [Legionella sp. PL877]